MAYFSVVPGGVIGSAHMNAAISQGIPPFGSAAERDAAIVAPFEGQRCFRTDLNRGEIYSGTAWRIEMGLGQGTSPTSRLGFGYWTGSFVMNASGFTQALDLSAGGVFTACLWAHPMLGGSSATLQSSLQDATITTVQLSIRDHLGTAQVSKTLTGVKLAYLASLAY